MQQRPVRRGRQRLVPLVALTVALPLGAILLGSAGHVPSPEGALANTPDFVNFEALQVHPVAMTPDGTRLLVLNTPDARLEVFDLSSGSPVLAGEVPVGLEPVSVVARNNAQAWVVNQVSDDVNVVDLATLHVTGTIHVGDEPTDVAFAAGKAFVCVSGEDAIKPFDPATLASAGAAMTTQFARHPRALAVNSAGTELYVTVRECGNKTTVVPPPVVQVGGGLPPPNPPKSGALPAAPSVGLIVQHVGGHWVDERGAGVKTWDSTIPYTLNEIGLIAFDPSTGAQLRTVTGLGSNVFNVAVAPVTDKLYLSALAAVNPTRFEINLRGRFAQNRVDVVGSGGAGAKSLVHLNDTTQSPALALALPGDIAVNAAGTKVYVAALGSGRIGVLDGSGTVTNRIACGPGPSGLALDSPRHRLYVLDRFSNSLAILDVNTETKVSETPLRFDPSPLAVNTGRPFLYDASRSAHGDVACASCHLGGDLDGLVWDLGDPQGDMAPVPAGQVDPLLTPFHPMKGPMITQSLRGLAGTLPLHWRGDRTDFARFNPAFKSLLGAPDTLSATEMQEYSDFIMTLAYPPNPNQNLDRTLPDPPTGASALRGQNEFLFVNHDGPLRCVQCHALPAGTNGKLVDGAALQESQQFKIPQLRNLYQKSGFTRTPGTQARGTGYTHDGSVDNLFNFLKSGVFQFGTDAQRRDVGAFMLCFDTGLAPAVGRELTMNTALRQDPDALALLDTLYAQAEADNCDLVAHAYRGGVVRGYLYNGSHLFLSDYTSDGSIPADTLLAWASTGNEVTYTGVPVASGRRIGIDRDRDGFRDRDEVLLGSNPADPTSVPAASAVHDPAPEVRLARLGASSPNPFTREAVVPFAIARQGRVHIQVFDLSGRLVRTLIDESLPAGNYHTRWDGLDSRGKRVASGRYFCRLQSAGLTLSRPMLRIQ